MDAGLLPLLEFVVAERLGEFGACRKFSFPAARPAPSLPCPRGPLRLEGSERAEVGAEAEAVDTDVERGTAAAEQVLEEVLEEEGAPDIAFDFDDFAIGEFFPARSYRGIGPKAFEEEPDFRKREIHFAGEADKHKAVEGFGGIAALAIDAGGGRQQTDFFVVADGGGVEAGAGGEFTDFHGISFGAGTMARSPLQS